MFREKEHPDPLRSWGPQPGSTAPGEGGAWQFPRVKRDGTHLDGSDCDRCMRKVHRLRVCHGKAVRRFERTEMGVSPLTPRHGPGSRWLECIPP